ncbi:WbqC family protein [Methylobacterium sp. NEAU 140]|uniref:WbqC family protein n=1 Tax=Methylobacterium sp. NEAU 140 TaxID=3064945 RepID=UPI002736C6F4|nr:WbqC family protein [Methylobacterium sp. NEAU 140]MDP4026009.1 WbqC family protein [Methylobacterium sp. NEAU 140]
MQNKIVVLQPLFLPWIGVFEQIKMADIYVHYDDVQLPFGRSFTNRVQLKTGPSTSWLTAPIERQYANVLIKQVKFAEERWRTKHLERIRHIYSKARYFDTMFELVREIYHYDTSCLADFNINALEFLARWLKLNPRFIRSSEIGLEGSGTERLLKICMALGGSTYITGHGAANYLDHSRFDEHHVQVEYINYKKISYAQLAGDFTPYVSIIDAIANLGEGVSSLLCSETMSWKDFTSGRSLFGL